MSEKKTNWNDFQLFIVVANSGGLSAAARLTHVSPATLGRRMLRIEHEMGQELFFRHDRGYNLTPQGQALLKKLTEIEAHFLRLTNFEEGYEKPLIKISAGTWTSLKLIWNLSTILGSPADISLRLVASEEFLSIQHREIAIGFRNQRPTEKNLAGRKISRVDFAPFAHPQAPKQWIKVQGETASSRWMDSNIGHDIICEVNTPRNALDLAVAKFGIVLLPTFIGAQQKELTQVGGIVSELSHDQWIVVHNDDRHMPALRRTMDRIYRIFQAS